MKPWYALVLSFLCMTTGQASAANWDKQLFQRLSFHPAFSTSIHQEQALILQDENETFYAAFATVQSELSPLFCAYAAPFDAEIGHSPGSYTFKPVFICSTIQRLKPYEGYFQVKNPPCPREVCANPAIGVGNLVVRPQQFFMNRYSFPDQLNVDVQGEIVPASERND